VEITDSRDFYHIESHLFGLGTLKRDLTASGEFLEKLPPGFYAGIYQPPVISRSMPLAEAQLAY
jgi:hypothetical protein